MTTSLALLVCLATAAVRYRAARRTARGARQAGELQTAITVLTGELRVGAHPAAAFAAAAEETDGSVAVACRAVAARARLGGDVVAGLRGASQVSVLSHQWDRLAVCWQLATEHGLAMAALMESAQRDIAERLRFCNHVRSAMAGARATATILAALPVLSVVMGQLIGARTLALLLGGHWGGWLLVGGTTLICGGLLWSDRITGNAATS